MDRVNKILADPEFSDYLQRISKAEEDRVFCSHHFEHLLATARLTWILLLKEGLPYISREIAYAAGLLHDLGRWHEYQQGGDHALYSAEIAEPLLQKAGFSDTESRLIIKAIKQHGDSKNNNKHKSTLSIALSRADKYSRLCFQCSVREQCKKFDKQPHAFRLEY